MKTFLCLLGSLSVYLALLAFIPWVQTDPVSRAAFQPWTLSSLAEDTSGPLPEVRGPRHVEALARRTAAKREIARRLVDGKLTFGQAAAAFYELDRRPPALSLQHLRMAYHGQPDAEIYHRSVITFVRRLDPLHPAKGEAAAVRLEEELARELSRPGGITWPEGDAGRP